MSDIAIVLCRGSVRRPWSRCKNMGLGVDCRRWGGEGLGEGDRGSMSGEELRGLWEHR